MILSTQNKWVAGILGTVVLGAVGSGLWEWLFAPGMSWLGRGFLTLVTLGLDSARDAIYQDVAKGHREYPSLVLFMFASMFMVFAPIFLAIPIYAISRARKIANSANADEIERKLRQKKKQILWLTLVAALLGSILFIRFMMYSYSNLAISHFNQSMNVIAPFISDSVEETYTAQFATIRTKQDYERLLNEIEQVAVSNNARLPDFSEW